MSKIRVVQKGFQALVKVTAISRSAAHATDYRVMVRRTDAFSVHRHQLEPFISFHAASDTRQNLQRNLRGFRRGLRPQAISRSVASKRQARQ